MALSDILESLTKPAPSFIDNEDDFGDNTEARLATKDKDEVESFGSTKLRRQAASLLSDTDGKYAGKKSSRKQIYEDQSENVENGDVSNEEDNNKDEALEEFDSEDDMEIESFNKGIKEKFQNGSMKDLGSDGFSGHDDDDMENDDVEEETDDDVEEEEEEEEESDGDEEDGNNEKERDETMELGRREEKDIQSFSKLDTESEIAKGKAVQSQLGMLDNFLEARIKIQRVVSSTNQIPQPDTWKDFMNEGGGNKFSSAVTKVQGSLCNLLNSLVELQTTVLMKNPQTQHIVTGEKAKEEDSDEDIFSDLEDEDDSVNPETLNDSLKNELKRKLTIDQLPMFLVKRARKFESYRNSTIQKWDDKTKLSSGKMSSKSFSALDQSAMKQVKQILYDKERLIKRTQLRRSIYKVFGKPEEDQKPEESLKQISPQDNLKNRDPEIFDDSDFYHMLLQDYIRRKSTESSDVAATTKQWMEIQQLRSKMKRKIDTRASKGRKIRYEVHKKLVNFMGPYDNSKWTQEMRDELYRSLFGQQCQPTKD